MRDARLGLSGRRRTINAAFLSLLGLGGSVGAVAAGSLPGCATAEQSPVGQSGTVDVPDAASQVDAGRDASPSSPGSSTSGGTTGAPAPTATTPAPAPTETAPPDVPPAPEVDAGPPAPLPIIAKLEPPTVTAGLPSLTLHVIGERFVRGALVLVGANAVMTTFRSETELEALLQSRELLNGGELTVAVRNPAPGGGRSRDVTFVVREDAPEITALEPSSVVVGSPATKVLVRGRGFKSSTLVHLDGAPVGTSPSADGLTFTFAAAALAQPKHVVVTVVSFGADESAPASFDVVAPPP